jgi:hypothetical protein
MLPAVSPPCTQAVGNNCEATKTEPDENTYLVFSRGLDGNLDHGTHFLFQGHESGVPLQAGENISGGSTKKGYITRINLDVPSDADGEHRVTLLATKDLNGNFLPAFDGSVWDPFLTNPEHPERPGQLLFSAEIGAQGGIWQATPDYPAKVQDISVVGGNCVLGRGGYEDIHVDPLGQIWIVEDVGGKTCSAPDPKGRVPNSFVYRFIPHNPSDLTAGGRLQALQVKDTFGNPITFTGACSDVNSKGMQEIHHCGNVLQATFVDLKMTAPACDANAAAKAAGATPFKRPENGEFMFFGKQSTVFYFDETGDTNLSTGADRNLGGRGAVLKLTLNGGASANTGTLEPFYIGDDAHTGFDNTAIWDATHIVFVEDAGDTAHTQRNAFDSGYVFDTTQNYCSNGDKNTVQPIRFLAQGRDASATIDSQYSGAQGFQNDGDNEITGVLIATGDPSPKGIPGVRPPKLFKDARFFYTQQHGDNVTYEINTGSSVTSKRKSTLANESEE